MEDQENRTEQPSGRRLGKAREEGQVALGRDAGMVAATAAAATAVWALAGSFRAGAQALVAGSLRALPETPFRALPGLAAGPAAVALACCVSAALAAFAVTLAQTRGGFWPHLALPDLTRVFHAGRLGRLFRSEFFANLGINVVKVLALSWAAWSAVRDDLLALPRLLGAAPPDQVARTFDLLRKAGVRVLAVAVVLAGADFALQRFRFTKRMRMTKQEAKREARDDEGDPLIRGKRRKRHREISRGLAKVEVPRADALVVNPTHVAVALRYRRDEGRAPRVTAKGKGALAEYMRELARENAVPIVQDIALARLLYRKVKVGREVPAATYKAVAAILAYVYRITHRPFGRGVSP
ncbi:MAG TPA: EscU/YscU/HrcU family type III secretion system export apparatus switch protein [Anaeromyxobacteraceae bacterium]|nr:EscU/YscU/HrcU family type III secretion system export apparatus switch protein [Anaeromyxobacteraceae bacterium]